MGEYTLPSMIYWGNLSKKILDYPGIELKPRINTLVEMMPFFHATSKMLSSEYPKATIPLLPILGATFLVTNTMGISTFLKVVFEIVKLSDPSNP